MQGKSFITSGPGVPIARPTQQLAETCVSLW